MIGQGCVSCQMPEARKASDDGYPAVWVNALYLRMCCGNKARHDERLVKNILGEKLFYLPQLISLHTSLWPPLSPTL